MLVKNIQIKIREGGARVTRPQRLLSRMSSEWNHTGSTIHGTTLPQWIVDAFYEGVLTQERARALNHNYIGTERLLLGLLLQEDATGVKVLSKLGVNPEQVRVEIYYLLRTDEHGTPN